jgi:hypothetical protein
MDNGPNKAIKIYSWLHPVSVLLLVPEIAYSVSFACWYLVESINHSGLGRTMDSHVGLGLLFMLLVYAVFFTVGLATLLFTGWRIYRSVKVSKGLLKLSEQDRKAFILANAVYSVFLICALLFVNYCDLPGRAEAYPHDTSYRCEEGPAHRIIKGLDILILPYFVSSLIFFSRRKTRVLFTLQRG